METSVRTTGLHCVKSVRIRSYSGPYFPSFGLNTERYGVSFRIQSEWGKMQTRITPNTDAFHAESATGSCYIKQKTIIKITIVINNNSREGWCYVW